jgi:tetratricopeptide (TPR) repeat protein
VVHKPLARMSCCLALVLLGCTTVAPEIKKDLGGGPVAVKLTNQDLLREAVRLFEAGQLAQSKDAFLALSQKAPKHALIEFNLGLIAQKQGQLAEASEHYASANAMDSKHKPTLLNWGQVLKLQNKLSQMTLLYEAALKDPAVAFNVELNLNLATAYRLTKRFAEAEACAVAVLSRHRDQVEALKSLTLTYFDQGKFRLAELSGRQAQRLDAKDPAVPNTLGLIALKLEERPLALSYFQKALTLNPNFGPAVYNLGAFSLTYRDYESAQKLLARAVELEPNSSDTWLAYGYSLDGQKQRDSKKGLQAGEAFERALRLQPNESRALCAAGWAYAADKDGWDKSLGFLEKCKASAGAQELLLINAKMKTLVAIKNGASNAPRKAVEKNGAQGPGPSLVDKISDDAAQQL